MNTLSALRPSSGVRLGNRSVVTRVCCSGFLAGCECHNSSGGQAKHGKVAASTSVQITHGQRVHGRRQLGCKMLLLRPVSCISAVHPRGIARPNSTAHAVLFTTAQRFVCGKHRLAAVDDVLVCAPDMAFVRCSNCCCSSLTGSRAQHNTQHDVISSCCIPPGLVVCHTQLAPAQIQP
jgi:hypothetical protein